MEEFVKFKDREKLYQNIETDLHLQKLDEHYSEKYFGNYTITFSAESFLIQYVNDRSQLMIYLASNLAPSEWLFLGFVKNFILGENKLKTIEGFALDTILEQNDFIKNHFEIIANAFNADNYKNTLDEISLRLKIE